MASLEGRANCRPTFTVQTFVQVNAHVEAPLDTARAHPCPILRAREGTSARDPSLDPAVVGDALERRAHC